MVQTIKKRNGSKTDFDREKIYLAVHRCLTDGLGQSTVSSGSIAEEITQRVINILSVEGGETCVEKVQDLVQSQLMAAGYYDAAEAYILYRHKREEIRRKAPPADPEEVRLLEEDKKVLKDPMQLFQHYSKYARWDEKKGRRESWS